VKLSGKKTTVCALRHKDCHKLQNIDLFAQNVDQ